MSDNANIKLKRCPFCGGKPIISKYDPYDGYQGDCTIYKIQCHKCGVTVRSSFRDTCINLWNRRVIDRDDSKIIHAVPHEMTAREYLMTEERMYKYYGMPSAFDLSGMTIDEAIEMVAQFAREHSERSGK